MPDVDEMGGLEKSRARDNEANILKATTPRTWQIIDPWRYKYLNRGSNYDCTFQPETKLGETIGCWVSRPFARNPDGPKMKEIWEKLRAEGRIKWDLKGFMFLHEHGVRAQLAYIEDILAGQLRATTSWGPNPNQDDDKSRFHKLVPKKLAEKYGFEYVDSDKQTDTYFGKVEEKNFVPKAYFVENELVIVTIDQIRAKYPELYERKTSTYVKKEEKLETIQKAREALLHDYDETEINAKMISDSIKAGWATEAEIERLLTGKKEGKEPKEQESYEAPDIDLFSDEDIVKTEAVDEGVMDEDAVSAVEELAGSEEPSEEMEHEDEVVAAVVATEESEVIDTETVKQIHNPDNCFENNEPHGLKAYSDARLLQVDTTRYDGVVTDTGQKLYFAQDDRLGDGAMYALQQGLHIIGDPSTGSTHLFEQKVVNVD